MSNLSDFFHDRIQINSVLIVLGFVSVLALSSQSAASYATYLLALSMLLSVRDWSGILREPMLLLIGALLGYLFLSSFWSDPFVWREAFSVFIRALLVFLFVVAFAECQQRGQLRRWMGRALAVVGLAAVIAALAVYFTTDPLDGRLHGLGQLRAHVVAALVYAVVLIFLLDQAATERSRWWRGFALVSAFIVAYAIFLSDSRNAWVSASFGVGTFMLAHLLENRRRFVAGMMVLVMALALTIAALLVNEGARELLLPRGDSFRLAIWLEIASRIGDDGLWFGLGINTPTLVVVDGLEFLHPHNLYLAVAYQGGLVALLLFAAVLTVTVTALLKHYHDGDAKLALGILGVALSAYFLDGYELIDKVGSTWFLLWLPVAISLGVAWRRPPSQA